MPAVAVIADAHLGGPGGEAEPLVEQLRALPGSGCRRLVLLGDLFHVWVADRRYETPQVRAVMAAVDALRAAGLRVDYVEGNRDFFVAESEYSRHFDAVGDEVRFASGDRRILAVHGDGLNEADRRYRFWRWLSKSPPSRFAMRHLPGRLARRLVLGTERGLARTNFEHKRRVPERVIRRWAERRFAEADCDAIVLGHFHEPHRWRLEGGEVLLLDAWFRSRRVEWL